MSNNIPISQCNWSTEGTDRNEPTLGIHPQNRQSETKVGQRHQCISNPKAAISNESISKFSKHIPITPENSIIQSPSIIYPHHSIILHILHILHHFSRDFPYFPLFSPYFPPVFPRFPPFSHLGAQQRTAPCGSAPAPRPWGRARRRWVRRCWCRPRGPWPRGNHGETMGKHEMRKWKTVKKKCEKYDEKIWWYQGGYMMVYEIYEIYLLKLDDMSHVEVGWLILFGRVRWIGCVRMAHRFLSSAIKPVKKN